MGTCAHAQSDAPAKSLHPTAQQLLDDVVAQFPREPLRLSGKLRVRGRKGIVTRTIDFKAFMDWGSNPATARYTIRADGPNGAPEELSLTRESGAQAVFGYAKGDPLLAVDLPDLSKPIHGTDVTWIDLTFSYLWWKGAELSATEKVLGYRCRVVKVPAPADAESPYAWVLLWIDEKSHLLLRAEGYDAEGELLRRLTVKAVHRKQRMISKMDIESFPEKHRTRLRVHDVVRGDEL